MSTATEALRAELRVVADRLVDAFKGAKPDVQQRAAKLGQRAIAIGEDIIKGDVTVDEGKDYFEKFKLAIVSEMNAAGYKTQSIIAEAIADTIPALLRLASAFLGGFAPLATAVVDVITPAPKPAPIPPVTPEPSIIPTLESLEEQIQRIDDMRRPELPSQPIPPDVRTGLGFTEIFSAAENLRTAIMVPNSSNPVLTANHRYELALNQFNERTRRWIVFGV